MYVYNYNIYIKKIKCYLKLNNLIVFIFVGLKSYHGRKLENWQQ